jgi:inorganic pyrophosphatase
MNLYEIPLGERAPVEVNVIVEIPQGSSNKMEYDPHLNIFKLDRTLYSPLYYPCNYGFIPSTMFSDGDPLDVLVLCNHPIPTGTLVESRPVGVLRMRDDKGQDDKIICVSARDPRYQHVRRLSDLSDHRRKEIVHFFQVYKDLEDKAVDVEGWHPVDIAHELILKYALKS